MTGNAIASFLSADYTYNLFQLRNEIVYSLSNNLYSSVITNHEPIVITHENISKNVIQNKSADNSLEDHIRITVTQLLPEIIDIYPDQPCETLENLLQTQLNASIVYNCTAEKHHRKGERGCPDDADKASGFLIHRDAVQGLSGSDTIVYENKIEK